MAVTSLNTILAAVRTYRRLKKRIVTTNGVFDLIHVGHVMNLTKAKALGDVLIVGINSDASVRKNKGKGRPIVPERERAQIVAAFKVVDHVFIFNEPTVHSWIAKIKPDIHVKGSDRTLSQVLERGVVQKNGGRVVLIPHTRLHTTTALLKKIHRL